LTEIKRVNYLILTISILGMIILFFIKKRVLSGIAFFSGGGAFLLLFIHLQYIIKNLLSKKKGLFVFTYFGRLFLITLFFYGSISISKDFFLFAMIGFIISSLSLIGEGIIGIITKGEKDG